jgi:hypothetical protein
MRKIKGGYFTDATNTQTPLTLADATKLTTIDEIEAMSQCSINDIISTYSTNANIDALQYTDKGGDSLNGESALRSMLQEVMSDTEYQIDDQISSTKSSITGGRKYKSVIKKVNKIKPKTKTKTTKTTKTTKPKTKTTKPKTTKPKTTKPKTTKPKTTKPKTTKTKTTKTKTTKTKTTKTKMKSCNCKK